MKRFRIVVEGRNFRMRWDDRVRRMGFFAARCVVAPNVVAAKRKALQLLRKELAELVLNERKDPPMFYFEQVKEVRSFRHERAPGRGCGWYPEEPGGRFDGPG